MKVLFSHKKKRYEEEDCIPVEQEQEEREDEGSSPKKAETRKSPRAKRQLLMAALVLALGSAVYLNWQFDGNRSLTAANALENEKNYGETQFVSTESSALEQQEEETSDSSPTSSSADTTVAATFAQARLDREEARARATELLQQVLESTDSDEEARKQAVDQAAEIAANVLLESNIETLITAKGYADCMVFLENGACSVLVQTDLEQPNDGVVIRDIVMDQTGLTSDKIKIVVNTGN